MIHREVYYSFNFLLSVASYIAGPGRSIYLPPPVVITSAVTKVADPPPILGHPHQEHPLGSPRSQSAQDGLGRPRTPPGAASAPVGPQRHPEGSQVRTGPHRPSIRPPVYTGASCTPPGVSIHNSSVHSPAGYPQVIHRFRQP